MSFKKMEMALNQLKADRHAHKAAVFAKNGDTEKAAKHFQDWKDLHEKNLDLRRKWAVKVGAIYDVKGEKSMFRWYKLFAIFKGQRGKKWTTKSFDDLPKAIAKFNAEDDAAAAKALSKANRAAKNAARIKKYRGKFPKLASAYDRVAGWLSRVRGKISAGWKFLERKFDFTGGSTKVEKDMKYKPDGYRATIGKAFKFMNPLRKSNKVHDESPANAVLKNADESTGAPVSKPEDPKTHPTTESTSIPVTKGESSSTPPVTTTPVTVTSNTN